MRENPVMSVRLNLVSKPQPARESIQTVIQREGENLKSFWIGDARWNIFTLQIGPGEEKDAVGGTLIYIPNVTRLVP